ncbi:Dipeptidyl aminopeptidase/acylaminoacyl peptidase [Tangfeifania diversioriginum]|uniref:Dipeptidyl aminopeptidase/acylaminoacyl peptidase n=1 Tax=Tangfeifania diversioriginum TaxID=1168035 RepID=A0A1M6H5X1_9BACT|nr:prolyl oligopeptidase family serine peptidase [Tangfeifania diversioriginum]SHJ17561.1 Dipeptidyl aminopeptidase/acylaminoacyl peptidase [Tangfeifania diversioriginum]
MRRTGLILLALFLISFGLYAQAPVKKALSIDDFETWNTISNQIISNNGERVAFVQKPQQGDGMLIVKHSDRLDAIPRGNRPAFGSENDFIVFEIKPHEDSIRQAKLDEVKKDKMPKDSLGIRLFGTNETVKFPKLKSYKLPEDNARWIAFLTEPAPAEKDTTDEKKEKKEVKQPGDDLVLFEVNSGDTLHFPNVTEYFYAKDGASVYFIQQKKDTLNTYSSVHHFNTSLGQNRELYSSEGWAQKAVADESGSQYAFLFSKDTIDEKVYELYYGTLESEPEVTVDSYTSGIPVGWSPSENGNIYFSEDGTKLYFGTAESPEPEPKDTVLDEEKPKLDVWSWHDDKLQPQQKTELDREKKRTFLAVYHTTLDRFIQLADLNIKNVSPIRKGNGNVGLGYNESPYLRASSWTGKRERDYYLVDFETGIKREIVEGKSYARLSPHGKYVVWYEPEDSSYYSRSTDINNLDPVALTKLIPVNFYDERNDRPMDPRPYGVAGWSENDRFVYIYDRYDIWKIDPSGERVPVNITKAFGRRNQIRLRYQKLDPELLHIPLEKNVLLQAIDEKTMENGFFSFDFSTITEPELVVMDKYYFGNVKKAKETEKLIWTRQNVEIFPDLWTSSIDFSEAEKISNANPQQDDFIWTTAELVEWNSLTGEQLNGILYKPENFNPNKKYPLMVYFYERNAENLFRHQHPAPSRSTINKTFYASNGYMVFVPDITYKVGYPGQSAYNAIVSGTQYLINEFPYIDEKNIGLQGQSWGGYQTAYLITQTDLYAAAMAGAPVSNMTSAYGGIRWGSGMSRMFQYEHTQSRIGGTLWEKPLHYIENSPLFYAPKVNTPLLMMHNDDDGAVPWYQGIEFFVALRRLNKPSWLLTYNGEPHNLKGSSWANRVDLSKRMFGFFNHYLKGEPMPEWMEEGIPAIEKGENLGY